MNFRKRSLRRRQHADSGAQETNLVPMMDFMMNLVAFLMISFVAFQIVIIDVPLPKIATSQKDIDEVLRKHQRFQLSVEIQTNLITVRSNKLSRPQRLKKFNGGDFDYVKLHEIMVNLKGRNPRETSIVVVPSLNTTYETIVHVLDATREYTQEDVTLGVFQPTTEEDEKYLSPETSGGLYPPLFPDVIMGGLS